MIHKDMSYQEIMIDMFSLNEELVKELNHLSKNVFITRDNYYKYKDNLNNAKELKIKCFALCDEIQSHLMTLLILNSHEGQEFLEYFSKLIGYLDLIEKYYIVLL